MLISEGKMGSVACKRLKHKDIEDALQIPLILSALGEAISNTIT
jgi:hypothetical protein